MQTRYLYLLCLILALTDIIIINISFFTACSIASGTANDSHINNSLIILNLLWLICSQIIMLYDNKTVQKKFFYVATLKVIFLHIIFYLAYGYFTSDPIFGSHTFLLLFYSLLSIAMLTSRLSAVFLEVQLNKKFKVTRSIALLGMNPTSLQLAKYFRSHNRFYRFAGFLNDSSATADSNTDFLNTISDQLRKAAQTGIKEIYVSLPPDRISSMGVLIKEADKQCIRIRFLPDFSQSLNEPFSINYIGDFPVISFTAEPLEEMQNRFIKRLFDIIFSLLVITLVLSWLYPLLALLIKFESRGPVVFKQLRSGRNNANFWCYKFRSMRINDDSHGRQACRNDERITKMGRILRKTSLDELPQFFNVLLGNMSVVGPRPHMLKHTEQYRNMIDKYMVRHFLKPGITGWAQINGLRGETKDISLMERRVEHDIWYVKNWSALLDTKIIILTVFNALRGEDNAF